MRNPFLIGEAIYLRAIERTDAAELAGWINHPVVRRTILQHRPKNLQAEEAFIDLLARSETDVGLLIVHKESDLPLGVCGLHQFDQKNRHAAFGIVIGDPREWDKGYGTEATRLLVGYAFETLNLNRLWLEVYEDNPRGVRAYDKVGFQKEGVLRQDSFREGRYHDTILMGILRAEWSGGSKTV